MNVLAIIPARAGSKGVRGKNKKLIGGLPLIEYSVQVAIKSKKIKTIVITTDDSEIVQRYANNNNLIIRDRPRKLASDESPIIKSILDVITTYQNILNKEKIDAIMLLQPTSPIRTPLDIDSTIDLLSSNKRFNSIISVCELNDIHPGRMYWIDSTGGLNNIMPQYEKTRRQDNPPIYFRNGAIYLARLNSLIKSSSIMVEPSLPYIMSSEFLLNIDSERDLLISEIIINAWEKSLQNENT